MDWFSGTVEEALQEYQSKNGLCIVYITRDEANSNEASASFDRIWDSFDRHLLTNVPYVAIKLFDGSDGAKQFAEFLPVCYLLGLSGQPLEVISAAEKLSTERFNELLQKGVSLYRGQLQERGISLLAAAESSAEKSDTSNEVSSSAMPIDERVQYAKKRLEEKRKADEAQKKEEEHQKELNRRNEGKLLADLKVKNRERELIESAEARRKEKENDAAALKRLREQIKQDKAERMAKASKSAEDGQKKESTSTDASTTPVVTSKPVQTDECRIQAKFPNGSTMVKVFASSSPLQVVVDAIREDGRVSGPFFLVQAYPRRQLMEFDKSLLELELTPSSALLVTLSTSSSEARR